jgi:transcriptional regulator with XRE-family HTH domain
MIMANPMAINLRVKKLGALLAEARLAKGESVEAWSQAIGILAETYKGFEAGQAAPSLPELEFLAYYLDTPLDQFVGDKPLSIERQTAPMTNIPSLVGLRNRLIGASLRKYRYEAGLSLDEVADQAAIKPEQLESYELGQIPIPVTTLEIMAETLGVSMKEFYDKKGPVGRWVNQQQMVKDFLLLPPEIQAFVSKPVNRPYLELAQRLGDLSVDKLRSVAEVLLEITL